MSNHRDFLKYLQTIYILGTTIETQLIYSLAKPNAALYFRLR